jgi:DNA repair exonuclease SbcCD ATPase subunit
MSGGKILELQVKNIKRLRAIEIRPNGEALVVVGGKNAQGKTSALDSIVYALLGKKAMPDGVVRDGALRGDIELTTDQWHIRRTITADGKQILELKQNGEVVKDKPQKLLDQLTHGIAFDPESFVRLDKKRQSEVLRDLIKLDLSDIDTTHAQKYAQRTEVNRDLKATQGQLDGCKCHGGVPKEELSFATLLEELRTAKEANAGRTALAQKVASQNDRRARLQEQIAQLQAELDALNNSVQADELQLATLREVPEEPIAAQLATVEDTNKKVRENLAYFAAEERVKCFKEKSDGLSAEIQELEAERARRIAACAMPVEGLGFNEAGEVTYQGIPYADCSSAERLRVAVAIGIAAHPAIPVVLIRDGSLLDADNMRMIAEMAEKADAQVWIERVTEDEDGAIIIEDGMVRG